MAGGSHYSDGWTVEDDVPVLFQRYRHQKPQAIPQTGRGHQKDIKVHQSQRKAYAVFMLASMLFYPEIPHGMAIFYGEKGAAKSTACSLLKKWLTLRR